MRRRREGPLARVVTTVLTAVLAAALLLLGWLVLVYPDHDGPGRGREVTVAIPPGATLAEVAADLEARHVIADAALFSAYARLLGASERLREGAIALRDDMPPRTVLLRIALGLGNATLEVTLPEGLDHLEIARRLSRWGIVPDVDAFAAAVNDPALCASLDIPAASAEGYLFPDTYRWTERTDAATVVRRMVENHRARTETLFTGTPGLSRLTDLGWGRHEAITLASIVEEEAAVAEERPIIAGVFLNRLRSEAFLPRHRLQADPTVSYGCRIAPLSAPSCLGFDGHITRAMLEDPANPYNTYRHGELPPGPISNPGLDALRAVLEAADHRYLYFVARGGGRHAFSEDLDAHNEAVGALRERER